MFLNTDNYLSSVDIHKIKKTFMKELSSLPNDYEELISWYLKLRKDLNEADPETTNLYDIEEFPGDEVNWFCAKIWDKKEYRIDPVSKEIFKNTIKLVKEIPGVVRLHINIVGPNSSVPEHVDNENYLDSDQHDQTPVYHILLNTVVGDDGEIFIINQNDKKTISQDDVIIMPVDVPHSGANKSSTHWVILGIIVEKSFVDAFY